MKKQLVTIPDKTLYEVTQKVTSFEKDLKSQIKLMRGFLKENAGAGLAANQIGFQNRVFVLEFEDEDNPPAGGPRTSGSIPFQAFINPEIVECSKDSESSNEGCLSVPQIELPVERALKIKIRYQNPEGKVKKLTARDIFARIIQHETDHLNGIIFTERIKQKFLRDNPDFKNLKIVFFGSGQMAATILEGLILIGLKPAIFTERGKVAGRNQKIKPTPVAEMAERFGKKYIEVEKSYSSSERSESRSQNGKSSRQARTISKDFEMVLNHCDLLICADFGQKIPESILKQARIAAINIHPSLLPKYRGAAPVQTAILDGAQKTGITIIKMTPKIDQGPILAQIETKISKNDNSLTLSKRLSTLAFQLLFEALPKIAKNQLQEIQQDDNQATFTRKFQKTDGEINWQEPLETIERKIRAFYPWPGTYTILPNGKRLLIHRSHLTGGVLVLDMVQLEGKKPVKWADFLRGYRDKKPGWFDKVK